MKISEIINKKTGEKLISFGDDDFEKVNPDRYYYDAFFVKRMMLLVPEEASGRTKPTQKGKEILMETAKNSRELIDAFREVELPKNLVSLLGSNKKSMQQKLLNGLVLTPDTLMGFILLAGDQGYTLSQYRSEFQTAAVDASKLPKAYRIKKDGSVEKFGNTELTDGQLRQALEQRSVKVAKIIERDEEWHCFFLTYNGISGKENWQNGQPHFHYISNLLGIKKEDLIEQIKSKEYKLGNLPHVALKEYRDQSNNETNT